MDLIDVQEWGREDPGIAPAPERLTAIKPGCCVKVIPTDHAERFWVEVLVVDRDDIIGRVDNDLLATPLDRGDRVRLQRRHVLDVYWPHRGDLAPAALNIIRVAARCPSCGAQLCNACCFNGRCEQCNAALPEPTLDAIVAEVQQAD
jgi:hypothetical protein